MSDLPQLRLEQVLLIKRKVPRLDQLWSGGRIIRGGGAVGLRAAA
jgi:hypothetical protein